MQTLRHARQLARLVLAWFALSLGVAIAAPLIHPASYHAVCASTGHGAIKLVADGETGDAGTGSPLHCPLCAAPGAPPPVVAVDLPVVQPLGHAVQPIPAARIAALTAAPLPARGPPSFDRS